MSSIQTDRGYPSHRGKSLGTRLWVAQSSSFHHGNRQDCLYFETFWNTIYNVLIFISNCWHRNCNKMSASSRKPKSYKNTSRNNSLRSISPRLCSCDIHDGHFVDKHVQDIEKFIHEETKALGKAFHSSRKERFGVFKNAFDMLIDESTSFKPLLADINAEYLGVIKAVEKGEEQRAYMSRDLKCVVGEKFTKENYEKRIQELEEKAKLIKVNNEQLREKYKQIQAEGKEVCPEIGKTTTTNNNLVKQSRLVLPGLRIEEQTDINVLSSALEKLRTEVQATKQKTKINYYPKERKMLLEKDLKEKERSRNHVSRYNKALREKLGRLTITVEVLYVVNY